MMQSVSKICDSQGEAATVVGALQLAGVPRENITVFAPPTTDMAAISAGPFLGTAFGTSAGLLAAISLAVNGFLPFGEGWLATAVVGGVVCAGFAGGLLGTLAVDPKKLAKRSAPQGIFLVIAEVDGERAQVVQMALDCSNDNRVATAA
jgi:hypothetical protein